MKQFVAVFMMFLSLLVGFQQTIIVMHFQLNQAKIEQAFCINKDKPAMHCHGICHLKKQLQKADNDDTTTVDFLKRVDMISMTNMEIVLQQYRIDKKEYTRFFKQTHYSDPYREIFVPPPIV